MKMINRMAAVGAAAAVGLGVGAANAAAYAITGGAYTGTATSAHTFTVAGAFTLTCPAAATTFSGTATGAASTSMTASFGPGCTFFGLPATVTQSGPWTETVTSGPVGGVYTGDFHIPAGSTTTFNVPSTGCIVTIAGTQNFVNATTTRNRSPTGVEAQWNITGIAYTASGCPFSSGTNGQYRSNGNVTFPGITVS